MKRTYLPPLLTPTTAAAAACVFCWIGCANYSLSRRPLLVARKCRERQAAVAALTQPGGQT